MLTALVVGLGLGFFGSVPIAGPISVIVLRRGLHARYASAVLVGVGAAVAEGGYALLAFWGFAHFLTRYPWIDLVSRAAAALILAVLGILFLRYRSPSVDESPRLERRHAAGPSLLLGFSITAFNPTLIGTWAAATTTLASTGFGLSEARAAPFAVGVAAGIASWFGLFSWILRRYNQRFERRTLERVVRAIGIALLGFSLWFGYRFAVRVMLHGSP